MITLTWDEFIEARPNGRPMAATVGVFDGIHLGHQSLIRRVVAHGNGCVSAVFTFSENPKKLLRPDTWMGDLASPAQKLGIFESLGLELAVLIDFSGDFSRMPGRNFLSLVMDHGSLCYMTVGSDFHCGRGRDTDAAALRDFYSRSDVRVEIVEPIELDGVPVSSTRIRIALRQGRIEEAALMLGRSYEMDLGRALEVEGAMQRFSLPSDMLLPRLGRYRVRLSGADGDESGSLVVKDDCLELWGFAPNSGGARVSLISLDKETKR
ncbi:MAG: FAD synthetase family protein [Spirochaetota bacterium]